MTHSNNDQTQSLGLESYIMQQVLFSSILGKTYVKDSNLFNINMAWTSWGRIPWP